MLAPTLQRLLTSPHRRALAVLAMLPLAVGCGSVPDRGARPATPLTVMTFNVRYDNPRDGANAWPRRTELVVRTIEAHAPHVLGLQEALAHQARFLDEALPHHLALGQGRLGGDEGEACTLLVDTRRLRVLESGTFWLSERPDVVGTKAWDAALPRICTWATVEDRVDGGRFAIFNTHFDHRGRNARERAAALIVERAAALAPDLPTIVLGDLNAGEGSVPLQTLHAAGWRDTYRVQHPTAVQAGTFGGWRDARDGAKIDFVLADARWDVLTAAIVHTSENGRFPSDHFPVVATLRRRPDVAAAAR